MKPRFALSLLSIVPFGVQPFHLDTTVGGTQTLEMEGDLSVKQYGGGLGGDLKVVGEVCLGTGAQALSFSNPEASGVTGYFWRPLKIGQSTSVVEYRFSKTGDETSGSFRVSLGLFAIAAPQGDISMGIYE